MIDALQVKRAIGIMSLMKYFPGDEDSRGALIELIGDMCQTDEQVIWLAKRMRNLYPEWPGAHELRAVLCSKYYPKDCIEVGSAVFLEGIPSETGREEIKSAKLSAAEEKKLLAPFNAKVKSLPMPKPAQIEYLDAPAEATPRAAAELHDSQPEREADR